MSNSPNKSKNTTKSESKEKSAKVQRSYQDIKKTLGLLLMFFSIFLLLSMLSFFLTWKSDMSLGNGEIVSKNAGNIMGKGGALISLKFIYDWFGISSLLFVFIFFSMGYSLFFSKPFLVLRKSIVTSLFFIFWISIALGLILQVKYGGLFGGTFGISAQESLKGFFGYPGTILFLVFILFGYLMIAYSIPVPDMISHLFRKKQSHGEKIISVPEEPPVISEKKIMPKDEIEFEVSESNEFEEEVRENNLKSPVDVKNIDLEIENSFEEKFHEEPITASHYNAQSLNPVNSLPDYKFPSIDLLKIYEEKDAEVSQAELEDRKNLIIQTLRNYSIEIDKIKATIGPTVTLFEIVPAAGIRISKIRNLEDDIALSLAALGIRIIAPIPGRGTIGIEVPNKHPEIVSIRSVIAHPKFQNFDKELPVVLGKTISNEVFIADLAKMPHLLIAGATGQGKSVGINVIITSLLYKKHPSQIKFVMIDPKKVELSIYQRIEKHFLAKLPNVKNSIITDVSEVVQTLNSLLAELDQRMKLFNVIPVRHITEYNAKFLNGQLDPDQGHRFLPYIVLIIDELADLMLTAGKEVEMPIARLAQIARAFGIHLIVSTQRPSVNIITGTIKANFPARIAFKVVATVDSRTILDHKGAEQLIGNGDMLLSMGSDIIRLQCPLIETSEVENIINFISSQPSFAEMTMLPEVETESIESAGELDDIDPMFDEAAHIVVQHQQGSTSLIQRRLKLGYNRAGRIIDQLEKAGIVGPFEGSKARAVLMPDEYSLEQFLKAFYGKL